jgi:Ca2+-binding EF-hand superfamily protein
MARIIHAVLDGNIEGDAEKHALKHAKQLIKMIDEDGDGTLTETEFICAKIISTLISLTE